jgi:hypothetical protein
MSEQALEITPEEEAADDAVIEAIQNLARHHKPDHLVFNLGLLFAQGLAAASEKYRDQALEEFIYRLKKYTGIELSKPEAWKPAPDITSGRGTEGFRHDEHHRKNPGN